MGSPNGKGPGSSLWPHVTASPGYTQPLTKFARTRHSLGLKMVQQGDLWGGGRGRKKGQPADHHLTGNGIRCWGGSRTTPAPRGTSTVLS